MTTPASIASLPLRRAVMTPLPRTATGKIFKRQLQAEMLHDLRAAGVID